MNVKKVNEVVLAIEVMLDNVVIFVVKLVFSCSEHGSCFKKYVKTGVLFFVLLLSGSAV